MPIDPMPNRNGNIRVVRATRDQAHVLAGRNLDQARRSGEKLYVSHFKTCPQAQQWRGERGARS